MENTPLVIVETEEALASAVEQMRAQVAQIAPGTRDVLVPEMPALSRLNLSCEYPGAPSAKNVTALLMP